VTRYDRDALLASVDLRSLADELIGGHHGSERSPTWSCPVPTHAQTGRTPPVSIFVTRWGEQRWRCHGCGASGSAIDLVMHTHGVDVRRAMELLASRTGLRADADCPAPRRRSRFPVERSEPHPGIEHYAAICAEYLWSPAAAGPARYLTEVRGLNEDVLRLNRIGFDPGSRHLDRPDGVPRSSGIVLPVLDDDGRAVFTQTRRLGSRATAPRYLNCANRAARNPRVAVYRSSGASTGPVVVCEGAIDALTAAAAGCRSVAVLGSTVADTRVADRIARLHADGVVIAFDADEAGDRGAAGLASLLRARGVCAARLRPPEQVSDLNGWSRTVGASGLETIAAAARDAAQRDDRAPPALRR
jgi:DNA primase